MSTNDTEADIVALNLVLRSVRDTESAIALEDWLSPLDLTPVWIGVRPRSGVTKIVTILNNSSEYLTVLQWIQETLKPSNSILWRDRAYELIGFEINRNSLHSITLKLFPTQPLPSSLGRAIHALVFNWLAKTEPHLSEQLHQEQNVPFSLSYRHRGDRALLLQIGLLRPELFSPLLRGIATDLGETVTLTKIPCRLDDRLAISASSTYEQLATLSTFSKSLTLELKSPTSFKQKQFVQPFPLPDLVFGNLLRRWNTFAPEPLHFPVVEWQALVAAYKLETYALKMKNGVEIGSQGAITYQFLDSEQAQIATVLSHFAFFSGIGRRTAMGMGQARLEIDDRTMENAKT